MIDQILTFFALAPESTVLAVMTLPILGLILGRVYEKRRARLYSVVGNSHSPSDVNLNPTNG